MSVHLLVNKNIFTCREEISLPVTSHTFFKKAWLPIALKKQLYWISEMEHGFNLDDNIIKEFLKELIIFKAHLNEIQNLSFEEQLFLEKRLILLIESLSNTQHEKDISGWVG